MSLWGDSPAGLSDEFHQHATGLHVVGRTPCLPAAEIIFAHYTRAAPSEPPSPFVCARASREGVVVTVWSTEHSSVGDPLRQLCCHHSISGVSAVPGHRQLIFTNLITDGERRVFGRVPLSVSTMDLQTVTHNVMSLAIFTSFLLAPQKAVNTPTITTQLKSKAETYVSA